MQLKCIYKKNKQKFVTYTCNIWKYTIIISKYTNVNKLQMSFGQIEEHLNKCGEEYAKEFY